MKIEFKRSFLKDLKKLRNKNLKDHVALSIALVELANDLSQVKNLKKLTGYEHFYRIRIGTYRIGIKVEDDIVYFVVFEHRKDIYRNFP